VLRKRAYAVRRHFSGQGHVVLLTRNFAVGYSGKIYVVAFPHVLPVESILAASTAITLDPRARRGQWRSSDSGAASTRTSS